MKWHYNADAMPHFNALRVQLSPATASLARKPRYRECCRGDILQKMTCKR
jgi:hypothetical protein